MKRLIRNCFLVQNPIRIIGMVVLDALLLTMTFCADLQDHPAASVIYLRIGSLLYLDNTRNENIG